MKKLVIIIASCLSLNAFSQTLSGSYLGIWSSDSHLGQFGFYDAGQTRPRLDIWGFPNKINFRTTYNTGGAALSFGTNAVNDAILINEDGKVGIGTITPTNKFQIGANPSSWTGNDFVASNSNGGIAIHSGPGFGYVFGSQRLDLLAAGNGVSILTNGNVGIGTTSPSTRLETIGAITINPSSAGSNYVLFKTNGTSLGILGSDASISGINPLNMGIYVYGNNNLEFWTNSSKRLVITGNGNVGIGIANPQYKLTVDGTIAAREVKVTAEAWADFVFHPTYKLRTLGEVEQFIKANNHLPEIPTETEVKENGIGLGEMNAKLLQKIEELTLYMIEMKKENEDLKNRVSVIENKQ